MTTEATQCCYCGLLCGSTNRISECPRRQRILDQDAVRTVFPPANLTEFLISLGSSPKPLIWVDSADVATMRGVVRFAECCNATIHIGQTTGTQIQKRVAMTEGWLGASLNEAAGHADLVISIGDSLLTELPHVTSLLTRRSSDEKHWCHVGDQTQQTADSNITMHRDCWYENLTSLLLAIREPSRHAAPSPELDRLRERLTNCRYGVIIWHADEFLDELDELVLRRLTELARVVSQTSRLSLVCVDSNPGRVTAHETMLWATGQAPSASFYEGQWQHRPELDTYALQDFSSEFTSTLMIRSARTGAPLPNLACDAALLPENELRYAPQICTVAVAVASVGEQIPGLLFRGDHATVLKCDSTKSASKLPTIEALLRDAASELSAIARQSDEN